MELSAKHVEGDKQYYKVFITHLTIVGEPTLGVLHKMIIRNLISLVDIFSSELCIKDSIITTDRTIWLAMLNELGMKLVDGYWTFSNRQNFS